MNRGTGPTANKFWTEVGGKHHGLVVGNGELQMSIDDLKKYEGPIPANEIAEILAIYAPEEKKDAPAPNAKRGPGRPRKVSPDADTARAVPKDGAE